MTALLVDTSVLIDALRGVEPARELLREQATRGPLVGSIVTRVEVLCGMRQAEERVTRALLDRLVWHPVDDEVVEEAGRLGRRWLPSHRGIDTADLTIAATASVLGLPLKTRNVRHFPMFADLASPY